VTALPGHTKTRTPGASTICDVSVGDSTMSLTAQRPYGLIIEGTLLAWRHSAFALATLVVRVAAMNNGQLVALRSGGAETDTAAVEGLQLATWHCHCSFACTRPSRSARVTKCAQHKGWAALGW
jgi:hypothetical protein